MIPDPTTAARRSAVPSASDVARRRTPERSVAVTSTSDADEALEIALQQLAISKLLDERLDLLCALWVILLGERIVDPGAIATGIDDSGRTKDREMSRDVRLRDFEDVLKMADAELALRQEGDDPEPSFVSERLEHARHRAQVDREVSRHSNMQIYAI
jgi:hypothetical protein